MPERGEELFQVRREKLQRLKSLGIDPYPPHCSRSYTNAEAVTLFSEEEKKVGQGARTGEVSIAGRIAAMRVMGKVAFLDLKDGSGRIQLHFRKDQLGERYDLLKELDLGDFLEASGPLFRTRTGEISLDIKGFTLLSKALRNPPEKWHGVKDVEVRYRQRYLDLISSDEVRRIFVARSKTVERIRHFLDSRGFIEAETPILLPVAAGAMARPFVTHHNALDQNLYMRIATELHLKRCIIGGLDKVYEIGRVFRNEGIDIRHNPEYTLLESYEAYADYNDVMKMVEEMVYTVSSEVLGRAKVEWGRETIDFTPPWRRLNLWEEIKRQSGIDIDVTLEASALREKMRSIGIQVDERSSWGRMVDKLISETVEPKLLQPTFLLDYPKAMSPLAKEKRDNPRYVERFEGFAGGMEIANAYSELNDPLEQRQRFDEQEAMRREYGDEDFDRLDEDFLTAMEYGMPPTGGLGVGIDRLVMLLTGQQSIREVVLFPQLRSREGMTGGS